MQYLLSSYHLLSQSFIAEVYNVSQSLLTHCETMLLMIVSSFSCPLFAWKWFTGLGGLPSSQGSKIKVRLNDFSEKKVDPLCSEYWFVGFKWFKCIVAQSIFGQTLHRHPKHRVKSLTNEQGKKALWVISLLCCIRVHYRRIHIGYSTRVYIAFTEPQLSLSKLYLTQNFSVSSHSVFQFKNVIFKSKEKKINPMSAVLQVHSN